VFLKVCAVWFFICCVCVFNTTATREGTVSDERCGVDENNC
jgi:hypothetical protein